VPLSAILADVWPALNATDAADAIWWTEAELVSYANQGLSRLARERGLIVERRTIAVSNGTSSYTLPARHLSTLAATVDGAALRPATLADLEARDAAWRTTPQGAGEPLTHYLQDSGLDLIRLYPIPAAAATLAALVRETSATLAAGDAVPLPDCAADWLFFEVLRQARQKESDGAMPEIAEFAGEMCGLYERIFGEFAGAGA
jgi:hypothetical protein